MELSKTMQILNLLIGEEEFNNLTTDIVKEYEENNMELKDIEPIIEVYSAIILLSGLSKEIVKKEKCSILINNNKRITVIIQDICNKYAKYMQKVETSKNIMLEKMD